MVKAFAVTNKGAEKICSSEIEELIKAKVKIQDSVVVFEAKDYNDLAKVTYKAQSISRCALLLLEFTVDKDMEKTLKNISADKLSFDWDLASFNVECERNGEHDFNSVDISSEILKSIQKKTGSKVDFDNPKSSIFIFIEEDKGYIGLDFSGFDLSKRQYKVFNHQESLKGTTGFIISKFAGVEFKHAVVDPFMGSGVIPIELGIYLTGFPIQYYNKSKLLFTKMPFFKADFFKKEDSFNEKVTNVYGYDMQLRYLTSSQKNAKLAGIEKFISLSKVDIDWLDTKFDKRSLDFFVTDPPRMGKDRNIQILKKVYKDLFYQAEYILKKNGAVVLLARDYSLIEEAASMHKFKLIEKIELYQGKDKLNLLKFRM